MEQYLEREGLPLEHRIGPDMGHKYDDASIDVINDRVAQWANPPVDPYPDEIRFTTYTLRYNRMLWVTVDALEEHWERAHIRAQVLEEGRIEIHTRNINRFTVEVPPQIESSEPIIAIDGPRIEGFPGVSREKRRLEFIKEAHSWRVRSGVVSEIAPGPRPKRHGLQGPIDDAFMNRFQRC